MRASSWPWLDLRCRYQALVGAASLLGRTTSAGACISCLMRADGRKWPNYEREPYHDWAASRTTDSDCSACQYAPPAPIGAHARQTRGAILKEVGRCIRNAPASLQAKLRLSAIAGRASAYPWTWD